MTRFGLAAVAVVLGAALVAVSILADELGIGNEPGFGWKQGIGVGVGGLIVLAGAFAAARARRPPEQMGTYRNVPRADD